MAYNATITALGKAWEEVLREESETCRAPEDFAKLGMTWEDFGNVLHRAAIKLEGLESGDHVAAR